MPVCLTSCYVRSCFLYLITLTARCALQFLHFITISALPEFSEDIFSILSDLSESQTLLSVCSQICEQTSRNIRRVPPPLPFRNKPQMKHSYLRRSVRNIKRPCNVGNYISDLSFVNIKIVNNMSSRYSVFAHNTSCKGTKNISRH